MTTTDYIDEPDTLPQEIIDWQPNHRTPANADARPAITPAAAMAVGALAVGALAIGAVVIGRLVIGKARIRSLDIDTLTVRRLNLPK